MSVYEFDFEVTPNESNGYDVDVPYIKDDIYDPIVLNSFYANVLV